MIIGYWLEKREKGTDYWARVNKMPVTKRGIKGWEYQVSCWGFVSVFAVPVLQKIICSVGSAL